MGLQVEIFRNGEQDFSNNGVSNRFSRLTLINVDGPDDPTAEAPAALLNQGPFNSLNVIPVEAGGRHTMMGGTYVATSDSRFADACRSRLGHHHYGAVALHDRVEG